MNYFEIEHEYVRKHFDLEKTIAFQVEHDVQIIRGSDYQYMCYIDKQAYAIGLTPMYCLTIGIENYNKFGIQKEKSDNVKICSNCGRKFTETEVSSGRFCCYACENGY